MKFGPGLLVAAAFIGPGTVLTASKAGAGYGFALIWAVVFSVFAAIIFQEMSARLGIVSGAGLGEALRNSFSSTWAKYSAIALVISAILIGNAAYESGNISGAVAGANSLLVEQSQNADKEKESFLQKHGKTVLIAMISLLAFAILMTGSFKLIQNLLIPIVLIMSLLFIVAAILSQPDWGKVLTGLLPRPPSEGGSKWAMACIGLIGTTVVPYNLFLHSASAAKLWSDEKDHGRAIKQARIDTTLAVGLGGLVTASILITACQSFFEQGTKLGTVGDVSQQIKPAIGSFAHSFFCIGLLAAGLTSAITAPLAACFATSGCLGRTTDPKDTVNRLIMAGVIAFGFAISMIGKSPSQIILFAQIANGIILPVVAVFLLIAMNRGKILGSYTNSRLANILGVLVIAAIVAIAGTKMVNLMIQKFFSG